MQIILIKYLIIFHYYVCNNNQFSANTLCYYNNATYVILFIKKIITLAIKLA